MINFFPFCIQVENIYNYVPPHRFFFKLMVQSGISPGRALGHRIKKKKKMSHFSCKAVFREEFQEQLLEI